MMASTLVIKHLAHSGLSASRKKQQVDQPVRWCVSSTSSLCRMNECHILGWKWRTADRWQHLIGLLNFLTLLDLVNASRGRQLPGQPRRKDDVMCAGWNSAELFPSIFLLKLTDRASIGKRRLGVSDNHTFIIIIIIIRCQSQQKCRANSGP